MANVDPRARFAGAASGYARFRPSYPNAASSTGSSRRRRSVRGTAWPTWAAAPGILTRLLAARGLDVVGVDPNDGHAGRGARGGRPAEYRLGEAAATGLGDASVALVTVAQAFHWFDADLRARRVPSRSCEPGGHVATIWNLRGESPFMAAYDALLRRFSARVLGPRELGAEPRAAAAAPAGRVASRVGRARTRSGSISRACTAAPGRARTSSAGCRTARGSTRRSAPSSTPTPGTASSSSPTGRSGWSSE